MTDRESWKNPASGLITDRPAVENSMATKQAKAPTIPTKPRFPSGLEVSTPGFEPVQPPPGSPLYQGEPATPIPEAKPSRFSALTKILTIFTGTR